MEVQLKMKSDEIPNLENRTTFEKILFAFKVTLSISVIITGILELTNTLKLVNNLSQFLLGCMFFVMFLEHRKYNMLQSCLSLLTTIFIISIFVIDYYNILI